MKNFQLYSTKHLLGGNMKYDLIVKNNNGTLLIDDFHITPISDKLSYNKYSEDNLLNYKHADNIVAFYKKCKGYFYNDGVDSRLKSDWPLLDDMISYDDTFYMGCKRSQYNIYGKQFEFLVPLWLEKIEGKLIFEINIYTGNNKNLLGTKELILNNDDKLGKYFDDYFNYTGLSNGDSKLMYINFDPKYASIHGLDLISGEICTKDISNIVNNLLYRERPLMEFDQLIIDEFPKNNILAKQLFNFNICFNVEDILPPIIYNNLFNVPINIEVKVKLNDEYLQLKDFYSNYDEIKVENIEYEKVTKIIDLNLAPVYSNALDYLNDNNSIELINKNKIVQKSIHWGLNKFPEYIFNVYDGFGGVVENGSSKEFYKHYYGVNNDLLYNDEFVPWLKTYIADSIDDIKYIVSKANLIESKYCSVLNKNDMVISNNIIYDNSENDTTMRGIIVRYSGDNYEQFQKDVTNIKDFNSKITIFENEFIIIHVKNMNLFILISDQINNLSYKYILDKISKTKNRDDIIEYLYNFMNGIQLPKTVIFDKSLKITLAEGPSKLIKEIQYYKNDNFNNYLYRYDGEISPSFIDGGNKLYYKLNIDDKKFEKKYLQYNFSPLYPSINYYSFANEDLLYDEPSENIKYIERKWFNKNYHYFLQDEIIIYDSYNENDPKQYIINYFKNLINDSDEKNNIIQYIMSCYNINYNLLSIFFDEKIKEYKYKFNIKLTLK